MKTAKERYEESRRKEKEEKQAEYQRLKKCSDEGGRLRRIWSEGIRSINDKCFDDGEHPILQGQIVRDISKEVFLEFSEFMKTGWM